MTFHIWWRRDAWNPGFRWAVQQSRTCVSISWGSGWLLAGLKETSGSSLLLYDLLSSLHFLTRGFLLQYIFSATSSTEDSYGRITVLSYKVVVPRALRSLCVTTGTADRARLWDWYPANVFSETSTMQYQEACGLKMGEEKESFLILD